MTSYLITKNIYNEFIVLSDSELLQRFCSAIEHRDNDFFLMVNYIREFRPSVSEMINNLNIL